MRRSKNVWYIIVLLGIIQFLYFRYHSTAIFHNNSSVITPNRRNITETNLMQKFRTKLKYTDSQKWYSIVLGVNETIDHIVGVGGAYFHPVNNNIYLVVVSKFQWPEFRDILGKPHYCAYYDSHRRFVGAMQGEFLFKSTFKCPLGDFSELPVYVTLFRNSSGWSPELSPGSYPWLHKITDLGLRKKRIESGEVEYEANLIMCCKALYGNNNWLMMLQMFEWHRIMGVEKFFMPVMKDVPEYLKSVLAYYQTQEVLEVSEWHFPEYPWCMRFVETKNTYCQTASVRGCLLDASYKYKYVLLTDPDELIQPATERISLLDIMKQIDQPKYGAFRFEPYFHLTTVDDHSLWPDINHVTRNNLEKLIENNLPILHYNLSEIKLVNPYHQYSQAELDSSWNGRQIQWRVKMIVKPETVETCSVHEVRSFVGHNMQFIVPPNIGYFHHFKNITEKRTESGNIYRDLDNSIWRNVMKENIPYERRHFELKSPYILASGKTSSYLNQLKANIAGVMKNII